MSSAVQTNSPRPATGRAVPTEVEADTIDTLMVLAPAVDPLFKNWKEGTENRSKFDASEQLIAIQMAAAAARIELERKFPDLNAKARGEVVPPRTEEVPNSGYRWAQEVHNLLSMLEFRIRDGYRNGECPLAIRDAVINGDSSAAPTTHTVLASIVTSDPFLQFTRSNSGNARALGIRTNLSGLQRSAA